jgi:hypothetical protein
MSVGVCFCPLPTFRQVDIATGQTDRLVGQRCGSVARKSVIIDFRQRDTKENDMPVDLWTKMALTLIALWKLPFADVGHAQTGTCGSTSSAPCHITNNGDALKVQIINAQDFH